MKKIILALIVSVASTNAMAKTGRKLASDSVAGSCSYTTYANSNKANVQLITIDGDAAQRLFDNLKLQETSAAGEVSKDGQNVSCSGKVGKIECRLLVDMQGKSMPLDGNL